MLSFKKWGLLVFISILVLLSGITYVFYQTMQKTAQKIYTPMNIEQVTTAQHDLFRAEKSPFSLALLGVDERGEDKGRADTIIICTINPNEQTAKLISIPRDTYVPIFEHGLSDKINHTYAYGGTELTVKTIEQLLEIPIHYVVKVNMEGFSDMIDAIGDIQVDNLFAFYYEGEDFAQGQITLDGERALKYVRMRFDDPQGDFGRQNRQKDVLKSLLTQAAKLQTVRHYPQILEVIEDNVEMNLSFETLVALRKEFMTSFNHIEQYVFSGAGKKVNGIYYYFLDEDELHNIQITLQSHLNLSTTTPQPHTQQIAILLNF